MNKSNTKIDARLKSLPKSPGVYLMKNTVGEIIYVGKAVDLSKRVKSYFKKNIKEIKTVRLVENIDDLEWMVTNSELEALMLETTLIKKYRPKYNILMKDDKNYAYIKIGKNDFPRVLIVRKVLKDGAWYFGPYTNAGRLEKVLRSLNRIFPFFVYQNKSGVAPMDSVAGKELFMKRAQTVWGDLQEKEVYENMIADLKSFLRGKSGGILKLFRQAMNEAAKKKQYEQAAVIRDKIQDMQTILEGQNVVMPKKIDADVIGLYGEKHKWEAAILIIRDGKMIDVKSLTLGAVNDSLPSEVVARLLIDYYDKSVELPQYIYLPVLLADEELLANYLMKKFGHKVRLLAPQKGDWKRVVELAERNAKLEYLRKQSVIKFARREGLGIEDLWSYLDKCGWEQYKIDREKIKEDHFYRVEAYDISNLGDTGIVGAMIRWELKSKKSKGGTWQTDVKKWDGAFNKKMYRRFEMRTTIGQDDFAAMKEIFERRFAIGKKDETKWNYPDLILVDGGKGQLGIVLRVLKILQLEIPVVSLAKREEEIMIGKIDDVTGEVIFQVLPVDKNQLSNLLMQSLRDEVHRFVISYQRTVRKKEVRKSRLDEIDGLGPKTKKLLLARFGSVKGIAEARINEIEEVVGKKLAGKIIEML
ncbi:MAG TPA: excinuclease ABC subunit UvrC [bacterium]|nr:excinuclease ABC subunit UvrC [bacterium]